MIINKEWTDLWLEFNPTEPLGAKMSLAPKNSKFHTLRNCITLDSYYGEESAHLQLLSLEELGDKFNEAGILLDQDQVKKMQPKINLIRELEATVKFLRNYVKSELGGKDKRAKFLLETFVRGGYSSFDQKERDDFMKFSSEDKDFKTSIQIINDVANGKPNLVKAVLTSTGQKILVGICERVITQGWASYLQAHLIAQTGRRKGLC